MIDLPSVKEAPVFGAFMCVYRTPFHDFIFHQFQSDVIKRQINEHLGANEEIVELDCKLTKAREIKQSLMQELLTGRIRLVKPAGTIISMPEAVHA
ncbi:MAG: hypothetical protein NTU79_21070 [Planctomycetota bacterium]|jgi:type I restriction enzyme, S subunit|nr:hypothetical protein [Planctomycetota bacterium]